MDHLVRYAIAQGVEPVQAIQMTTLTPAEAFRVDHWVGSLAPGRIADLLLVDDLRAFTVQQVYAGGFLVAEQGRPLLALESPGYPPAFHGSMRLEREFAIDDLALTVGRAARQASVLVMHLETSQLRVRREATLRVERGVVLPNPEQDVLYITVVDRHSGRGRTASALVGGFGLKRGAFATSLSPDDDNIICIGASLPDMCVAVRHLFEIGGGQVVVEGGRVCADLWLPICGIMANLPVSEVAKQERALDTALRSLGVTMPKPFFSILFLSITAIPELAITDLGLVDASTRQVVDPILSWS
jgi:adenine deaminase